MPRILIVDDEPGVVATFRRALHLDGYDVHTATTGDAGFIEAVEWQPDAILLDLRMPQGDGVGTLRRIRGEDRLRHTPVAVITGDLFTAEHDLAAIAALGAVIRFKPIWLSQLANLVEQLLATAGSC